MLILLFIFEFSKPPKVDWRPSFNHEHKKPWGTYVLYHELDQLFSDKQIELVEETVYERLKFVWTYSTTYNTYVFLNDYINLDEKSEEKIYDFVQNGNDVVFISNNLPYRILDSLNIVTRYNFNMRDTFDMQLSMEEPIFSEPNISFDKGINGNYFSDYPDTGVVVLGRRWLDGEDYVNFIKVPYGNGDFYFNTQAYPFTNYHMLKNDHHIYVSNVLSYVRGNSILWDARYKSDLASSSHPLRYIFANDSLKWAWRLLLIGFVIFVLFSAKRKQRVIPKIDPLQNTSLDFVKTISNLYYQEGQTEDIIYMKLNFFLEEIRSKYALNTEQLDQNFINRLSQKSGVNVTLTKDLILYIIDLPKRNLTQEEVLITLIKKIENFQEKAK